MKNIPLYEVRPIADLKDMLQSSVSLYGEKAAYLVKKKDGEGYSPVKYLKLKNDVDALGTALCSLGLKDGRIAVIGENRYEWVVSYLAIVNGTGVVVPLDKELPENEIEMLLVRSHADAVVFSGVKKDEMANISARLDFVKYFIDMDMDADDAGSGSSGNKTASFGGLLAKGRKLMEEGEKSFTGVAIDPEKTSILLFTSGTTEQAKAVMLCHRNIVSNLTAMCSMLYIDTGDIFLSVLPIHHTYECTCGFLCQIYRGTTVAFCEGLRHIPKNLCESKATVMLGVPLIFETMYKRIWDQAKKTGAEKKLKIAVKASNILRIFGIDITKKLFAKVHESFGGHLRLFISGAAGIDPSVAKGFRELGILFVQGYGLTECSPIVALNRNIDYKDDAAGLPLPNLEVRIDNPGADGVGEIIARGPSIMQGYYENPEANAAVFRDGWFRTGDLGYMDKDGFVHITGREKNVIVTKNGKNIYPEEIEALLDKSPYIKESMVYGKREAGSGDMMICASILPDSEFIASEDKDRLLSVDDIYSIIRKEVKAINKQLVLYKHIRDFRLRETEFAKTTTRKIKRYMEDM